MIPPPPSWIWPWLFALCWSLLPWLLLAILALAVLHAVCRVLLLVLGLFGVEPDPEGRG